MTPTWRSPATSTPATSPTVAELRRKVEAAGLDRPRVTFHGEVDRQQKLDLLRRLDVLSVPTVYREPKGLFVLEALANSVPLVLPRHGSFPELLEHTGGGTLVEPESVEAVTRGLAALRDDPELRRRQGGRGPPGGAHALQRRRDGRRDLEDLPRLRRQCCFRRRLPPGRLKLRKGTRLNAYIHRPPPGGIRRYRSGRDLPFLPLRRLHGNRRTPVLRTRSEARSTSRSTASRWAGPGCRSRSTTSAQPATPTCSTSRCGSCARDPSP